MRPTTISIIVFHLLALTLAAPAGNRLPKNKARDDLLGTLGQVFGAVVPSPWAPPSGNDLFDNLPPLTPPSRRRTSPESHGGTASKPAKRGLSQILDILKMIAASLGIVEPSDNDTAQFYSVLSSRILKRMSLLKDPLLDHLREGANDLGQGFELAEATLLEKIMIMATAVFSDKERLVEQEVGSGARYIPHSLMDLLDREKGNRADIKGPVTCPDGTTYNQTYVMASYELAKLPEVMDNFPQSFANTHTEGGKTGQLFTGITEDLMQSPMVDDLVRDNKIGKHSVVIDTKNNFLGVVQDNGDKGFAKCEFKTTTTR